MTHSKIASNGFYQELGKIFYSIAAADEVVKKEELETLRAITSSFHGNNKSELVVLSRLEVLLAKV